MQNLLGLGLGGNMGGQHMGEFSINDTSEQIHISCLALLKMLKHGKLIYQAEQVSQWRSWD
jgi:hypothetical protein